MKIKIRPFTFHDTQSILTIINFNILNTTSVYDYEARSFEQQTSILQDKLAKNFPFIVAEFENKVVGYGTYGDFRFKKAYQFTVEHSVYIDEKFQGVGVGRLLLKELIDLAYTQKLHTMIAFIDSANQGSVEFHKKFGFETVGIIKESGFKFNKWLDLIMMQRILK